MKRKRQEQILLMISQQKIGTQEELAALLQEKGFPVTQATISRDIRELHLSKVSDSGGAAHYVPSGSYDRKISDKYIRVLRDAFVSVDTAGNLLVIKTVSGMAMAAAAALDEVNWTEIVGCIAGDNTIMCAIRTQEEARQLMRRLQELLED